MSVRQNSCVGTTVLILPFFYTRTGLKRNLDLPLHGLQRRKKRGFDSMKRGRNESEPEVITAARPAIGGPHDPIHTENPVKAKLKRGEVVLAGTICTPSVESAVVMASAFDVLWIEGEHSAVTLESTRNIILATRGMRAVPFVRVPWQELWMAKRVMDIGALGVIFPFCSTVERSQQAAHALW